MFTHPRAVPLTFNQVLQGTSRPFLPRPHRGGTLHPISRLLNILACPVVWSVNTPSPSRPHFLPSELPPPRPIPPHPRLYPPSPIPPAHDLPYIPPAPLPPGVHLHPAITALDLQYDMRFFPTQSNPHLSPAILAQPASGPPLPNLGLRAGDLPWLFNVTPDLASHLGMPTSQFRTSFSPSITTSPWL